MKRSYEKVFDGFNMDQDDQGDCNQITRKVLLVEREFQPQGISLVNPAAIAKKSYIENMELADDITKANSFTQANAINKLEMIGRQMKSLHGLMSDVLKETQLNNELHNVACNFVKKPGNAYHLYQRASGQQYFSMLSPEEWGSPPHQYLGSYRLQADYSWTPLASNYNEYEGLAFLKDYHFGIKSITDN